MITIAEFSKMLANENEIVHEQTRELSNADALIQPQPSGNCLNWVLGHMLDNQILVLKTLGGSSSIERTETDRYRRDSEPIRAEGPGVWTLEQLLAGHDQLLATLTARLGELTETDLDEEIQLGERKVKRGWWVFFLHFHYTYHLGQLEYLRQLAGKTDKVI